METNYVPLADAIMLGAAITTPAPLNLNHCALGMAANALGIPKADPFIAPYTWTSEGVIYNRSRFDQIRDRWPWLMYMRAEGNFFNPSILDSNWNWIADAFNHKVCPEVGEPTMTLEELCVEVRKMEAAYVSQPHPQSSTFPLDTAHETDKIALAQG